MKKKTYFDNLNEAIKQNNKKALKYRDGRAWDNKKKKTKKSHMPRGSAYRRLESMAWKQLSIKIARAHELFDEIISDYSKTKG